MGKLHKSLGTFKKYPSPHLSPSAAVDSFLVLTFSSLPNSKTVLAPDFLPEIVGAQRGWSKSGQRGERGSQGSSALCLFV